MKIKIDCTVDVDSKLIKKMMAERLFDPESETVNDYVRSVVIASGIASLEESVHNYCVNADIEESNVLHVKLLKQNYSGTWK